MADQQVPGPTDLPTENGDIRRSAPDGLTLPQRVAWAARVLDQQLSVPQQSGPTADRASDQFAGILERLLASEDARQDGENRQRSARAGDAIL